VVIIVKMIKKLSMGAIAIHNLIDMEIRINNNSSKEEVEEEDSSHFQGRVLH